MGLFYSSQWVRTKLTCILLSHSPFIEKMTVRTSFDNLFSRCITVTAVCCRVMCDAWKMDWTWHRFGKHWSPPIRLQQQKLPLHHLTTQWSKKVNSYSIINKSHYIGLNLQMRTDFCVQYKWKTNFIVNSKSLHNLANITVQYVMYYFVVNFLWITLYNVLKNAFYNIRWTLRKIMPHKSCGHLQFYTWKNMWN